MFLTDTETNNVRVTIFSVCEAYRLSVAVCRPYLVRALRDSWVTLVWATATAYALGMVARDVWEWGRPRFCQWMDNFVESCLAEGKNNNESRNDGNTHQLHRCNFETNCGAGMPICKSSISTRNDGKDALRIAATPTRNLDSAPVKRGIRELRSIAVAEGIRGAGRMNLAQLAEYGYGR